MTMNTGCCLLVQIFKVDALLQKRRHIYNVTWLKFVKRQNMRAMISYIVCLLFFFVMFCSGPFRMVVRMYVCHEIPTNKNGPFFIYIFSQMFHWKREYLFFLIFFIESTSIHEFVVFLLLSKFSYSFAQNQLNNLRMWESAML